MARFILVPGKLEFTYDGPNGLPVTKGLTFAEFLKECCKHPKFVEACGDGFEAMDVRAKLLKGAAQVGEIMELKDTEWECIAPIAKNPPYIPDVMYQLGTFMRAMRDAPTKDPRPEATAAANDALKAAVPPAS